MRARGWGCDWPRPRLDEFFFSTGCTEGEVNVVAAMRGPQVMSAKRMVQRLRLNYVAIPLKFAFALLLRDRTPSGLWKW